MGIFRKSLKPVHLMSEQERNTLLTQVIGLFDNMVPELTYRQDIRSEENSLLPDYLYGR